jgi:SAM-dependent methyltransferase
MTTHTGSTEDGPSRVDDPAFWEASYREHRDGWELGAPTPPLARALRDRWIEPGARALVVGCGRGHEVRALAAAGWAHVSGIDFAESAIAEARRLTPPELASRIAWRQEDLFALPDADFDTAVEHSSLCAIDPARRAAWFAAVHRSLRPGGALLALFYTHGRPGGPPFGATSDELSALATAAGFTIERAEIPEDSVAQRRGDEWLVLARA